MPGPRLTRDEEFGEYFDARVAVMRRTAYLLCGDWHRAEDLVQSALVKLYAAWPRLRRAGAIDAYARQVLVRTAIDDSRRWFRRHETPAAELPEAPAGGRSVEDEVDVRRALSELPPRQRAVVVLRYWEDLPVAETAAMLGCTEGTVKSQTAKGLAALRRSLAASHPALEEQP